jgi:hypothetical protein
MSKIFFNDYDKKSYVMNSFSNINCFTKSFKLILVSCYFTIDSAENIIYSIISENINLTEIQIYIDRGTALSIGKNKLGKFYEKFTHLKFSLKVVDQKKLFHSKAYCLISEDKDH